MARPFKFPDPKDRSQNQPAVLCPADRVKALYDQDSGDADTAKKVSGKVRTWFEKEAKANGWVDVRWFKDVSTNHGAGCVISIVTLAFGSHAGDDEEDD
ncbi:MAG: hypothetical protein IT379_29555 [Deltaproteobacteria bacterium]|nr:hypothetical protein [Deltaproteobacteria bacterium]